MWLILNHHFCLYVWVGFLLSQTFEDVAVSQHFSTCRCVVHIVTINVCFSWIYVTHTHPYMHIYVWGCVLLKIVLYDCPYGYVCIYVPITGLGYYKWLLLYGESMNADGDDDDDDVGHKSYCQSCNNTKNIN